MLNIYIALKFFLSVLAEDLPQIKSAFTCFYTSETLFSENQIYFTEYDLESHIDLWKLLLACSDRVHSLSEPLGNISYNSVETLWIGHFKGADQPEEAD